jgi:hypothetical protein
VIIPRSGTVERANSMVGKEADGPRTSLGHTAAAVKDAEEVRSSATGSVAGYGLAARQQAVPWSASCCVCADACFLRPERGR